MRGYLTIKKGGEVNMKVAGFLATPDSRCEYRISLSTVHGTLNYTWH